MRKFIMFITAVCVLIFYQATMAQGLVLILLLCTAGSSNLSDRTTAIVEIFNEDIILDQ